LELKNYLLINPMFEVRPQWRNSQKP